MGEAEQLDIALPDAAQARSADLRLASTSPHLRDQLPAQGGDIVRLSMVLGHTQITTTQRYLHLLTEDLSASHQKVSILNRLG